LSNDWLVSLLSGSTGSFGESLVPPGHDRLVGSVCWSGLAQLKPKTNSVALNE